MEEKMREWSLNFFPYLFLKIFEMTAQQASSLDSIQMLELEPRVFDSYSSKMVEWRDDGVSEDEGMTKSKIRRDENYVGSVWVKQKMNFFSLFSLMLVVWYLPKRVVNFSKIDLYKR